MTTELPIACDPYVFTPAERTKELALATAVLREWPTQRAELPDGYQFHYLGDEQRFLALAEFVSKEHRCCPWARFALVLDPAAPGVPSAMRLAITGGADARRFLGAGFALLDTLVAARDPAASDDAHREHATRVWMQHQQPSQRR